MKKIFYFLLFLSCVQQGYSQTTKFTLNGTIIDQRTGESIIGAVVKVDELPGIGTTSNEAGYYSITLPQGSYHFSISTIGYNTVKFDTLLKSNLRFNVGLVEASKDLNEFTINSDKDETKTNEALIGVEKINMSEINKLPVLFGERDILKSIQLLPGVMPASEGSSGYHVRGGSTDQNLILLDDAVVYNPSHLFGFFSTFNSDAIKDATLYKGVSPANFGGRLSSVLDVRMNDGDNQQYHISGGIGLISSRLNVEGPIQKGKSSFLFTGRRTYADLFLKLAPNEALRGSQLYFYDINGKMNFQIGKKSKLFISGYFGQDVLGLNNFTLDWLNGTATVRFNHEITPKIFSNSSFIFTDYQTNIKLTSGSSEFKIRSEIMDFSLKQEFQFYLHPKISFRAGIGSTYHVITPGEIDVSGSATFNLQSITKRFCLENNLYINGEWNAHPKIKINAGLRLANFNALGEGYFYSFNSTGAVTDSTFVPSGQIASSYWNLEPRFSVNFMLAAHTSLKIGYARHTQFLHLLSNSTANNPTDKWIPSSINVRPEISDQVSLGVFQDFKKGMFEVSIEGYYKNMLNQVDYRNGADVLNNELYEGDLLFGEGRAYGLEVLFRKKKGNFTGWISYTLSRTEKQISGINNGNWYPAKQDRTHDLSIVLMYNYKRWNFAATWVYYTGNAVTFPSGKYEVDGVTTFVYTERNGYRMPDYHRLDLGITVDVRSKKVKLNKMGLPKRKMLTSEIGFGAYNVYNQWNTYSITFGTSETDPSKTVATSTSLFGIIPYISYNFKF